MIDETRQFLFNSNTGMERIRDVAVGDDGRVYIAVAEIDEVRRGRVVVLENPAMHSPVSVQEDVEGRTTFSYGPNPLRDQLQVSLHQPAKASWTIRIMDLMGRSLVSLTLPASIETASVNTSGLVAGSYLLVIDDGTSTRTAAVIR